MRRSFAFLSGLLLLAGTPAAAAEPSTIIVLEPDSELLRQSEGMVYIDEELRPDLPESDELLGEASAKRAVELPIDLLAPMHHLYTDLRRGLQRYRLRWSGLPQIEVPDGPALRPGDSGARVATLRQRLGLPPGDRYDEALAIAVRDYQAVHGLGSDGVAGPSTVESLNLGADHYEEIIRANLGRVRALPIDDSRRYILVDAAAAELWIYENGRPQDRMRAIVGAPGQPTPMMAALIRYAEVNPYWNVPSDFTQSRIAQRVLSQGTAYLRDRGYEVLSDWSERAVPIDPDSVDWQAVADGRIELRVRQLPGANNSMGEIKFMMPNHLGIYLHDTPDKSLFQSDDRWISNGCVRVEDARRLARWLLGEMPHAEPRDRRQQVDLDDPVPVYITYLTAAPGEGGEIVFRADPYDWDRAL